MGKRKHSEANGLAAEPAISNGSAKKSRPSPTTFAPLSNATPETKKHEDKETKKSGVEEPNGKSDRVGRGLSKQERKALKKAQRQDTKIEDIVVVPVASANGTEKELSSKAEKRARKALRKAEKLKATAVDSDTEPSTTQLPSLQSSIAPSEDQSSVTTPEPSVSKSVYTQNEKLSSLPQSTLDTFLSSNDIQLQDPKGTQSSHRPITSFAYLPTLGQIAKSSFAAFAAPTPIQAAAWPYLFSNRDLVGIAETGSGKTLAFGVPCVRRISSLPKSSRKGVRAVIVSPTRELAVQIHDQLVKIATPAGLNVVCVYGGVSKDDQRAGLRNAHIVVATPGRLNDLLTESTTDLSQAEFVCLDEADRMLDKGFEEGTFSVWHMSPSE